MGRSAKFAFPVPGRRQKQGELATGAETVAAAPVSKAEKILGSSRLNVDVSPQPWDSSSNSGMSVAASESTQSLQRASDQGGSDMKSRRRGRRDRWEEESDTLPAELMMGVSSATGMRPSSSRKASNVLGKDGSTGNDITELSSLGPRRQSSSTIRSWYDKSRVPLSISQQTSASAMAKGLPSKANTLLDLDNSRSGKPSTKKKRSTSRLDISTLLQRKPSFGGARILSHDFSAKSPTLTSITNISPSGIWAEHRANHRSTRELLHDIVDRTNLRRMEPVDEIISARRGNEVVNLHHLYDHYEQMTFRNVMDADLDEKLAAAQPTPATSSQSSKAQQQQQQSQAGTLETVSEASCLPTQYSEKPPKLDLSDEGGKDDPDVFDPDKPITPGRPILSTNTAADEEEGGGGCCATSATSISSRYTRTSKASRRTTQSGSGFLEYSDLQQTSVLSLSSSDSEGDDDDNAELDNGSVDATPKISISAPGSQRGSSGDEMMTVLLSDAEQRWPATATRPHAKAAKKYATFAAAKKSMYLTIPNESSPTRQPPNVAPRTSSLAQAQQGASNSPISPKSSSRLSIMSTSTANSALSWQSRPGYGVQEARAVTILPPQALETTTPERRPPPPPRVPLPIILSAKSSSLLQSSTNTDQPTPPLSPTSVDFTIRPSAYSDASQPGSRFMAVTKQEEMLLAALRLKRACMRDTMLGELAEEDVLDDDDDDDDDDAMTTTATQTSRGPRHSGSLDTLKGGALGAYDAPVRAIHHRHNSKGSEGSIVSGGDPYRRRHHNRRPVYRDGSASVASLPVARGRSPAGSVSRSEPFSGPDRRTKKGAAAAAAGGSKLRDEASAAMGNTKHERIMLYLHEPAAGHVDDDEEEEEEPSPDLSDYMLDSHHHHHHDSERQGRKASAGSASQGSSSTTTDHSPSASSPPPSPRSPVQDGEGGDDVANVRVVGDEDHDGMMLDGHGHGIPRPDSPVSPHEEPSPSVDEASKNNSRRKKAVRISAVGRVGMEAGLWGDDG